MLLEDRPLTLKDLARRWQVTEHHVRNLAIRGKLDHFRLGKLYRFPQYVVDEYERQGTCDSDKGARSGTPTGPKT